MHSSKLAALRYFLDKNLPPVIAERLRVRGVDAVAAVEEGRAGRDITDEDQLAFAAASGRTLVTSDRDFVRLSAT